MREQSGEMHHFCPCMDGFPSVEGMDICSDVSSTGVQRHLFIQLLFQQGDGPLCMF